LKKKKKKKKNRKKKKKKKKKNPHNVSRNVLLSFADPKSDILILIFPSLTLFS
jgi:hypothetical protein